jgi:hypothetical protein
MYPRPDGAHPLVTRQRSCWTGKGAKPAILAFDGPSFIMVRRWLRLQQRAAALKDER